MIKAQLKAVKTSPTLMSILNALVSSHPPWDLLNKTRYYSLFWKSQQTAIKRCFFFNSALSSSVDRQVRSLLISISKFSRSWLKSDLQSLLRNWEKLCWISEPWLGYTKYCRCYCYCVFWLFADVRHRFTDCDVVILEKNSCNKTRLCEIHF